MFCKFVFRRAHFIVLCGLILCVANVSAQNPYEDKPISEVTVTFEGSDKNVSANETFRILARDTLGANYSSIRVREAIEKLYNTKQIAAVTVEANELTSGSVAVRFIVRRKTQAQRVTIQLPPS